MVVIILTIYICLWVSGVCWVLGFIQNKFQQAIDKYRRFKQRYNDVKG